MNWIDYAVWPMGIATLVVFLYLLDQLCVIDLDVIGWLREKIPCCFCQHEIKDSHKTCKFGFNCCNWDRKRENPCCRCKHRCYKANGVKAENNFSFKWARKT